MKLVTTFVALERLTPAYRWKTEVFALGPVEDGVLRGDLLLRGYGDPWLVAEEFWKLAGAVREAGIRRIEGDLVIDESFYRLPPQDPAAFDGRPDRVYNLVPHPLLVNFNALRLEFAPSATGDVAVRKDPPLPNVRVDNRLALVEGLCRGYQRGVALNVMEPEARDRVLLEGRFPAGCERYAMTRSVLEPESYAYGLFGLYWRQLGGELTGEWRHGRLPPRLRRPSSGTQERFADASDAARSKDADAVAEQAADPPAGRLVEASLTEAVAAPERPAPDPQARAEALVHVHRSRPLGDLVRLVNKYSNNVMTRQIHLTLGAEAAGEPATPQKGRTVLREVLSAHGVDVEGLVIDNPAGLSREARLSARQLADVLQAAWRSPYMPEFLASLALAGMDGTMHDRFDGTELAGRMHLKTGTLDDVSGIAGYVQSASGTRRLVVVFVNSPGAHRGPGEELQDAVLRWAHDLP